MFGPPLAQVVGATTLLSAADRLPPRAAMTGWPCPSPRYRGAGPARPAGVGASSRLLCSVWSPRLGGGVRYGLLNEILPKDGYLLGRSVLNMAAGTTQICGFAAGGVLVAVLSPRAPCWPGAALYLSPRPSPGSA